MRERLLRFHFLARDELESELFESCLRLRRARLTGDRNACPSARDAEEAYAAGEDEPSACGGSPARRCYMSLGECADLDFPRLLEADERSRALIGTLHDIAFLLRRFADLERGGRGSHVPS